MTQWFPLFLFIHILTAIVAFGPTFAFSIIGRMGGAEPQHANFATRVSNAISHRIVLPAALTMPISGVLMIWSAGLDVVQLWLVLGVGLYIVAIAFSVLVQTPAVERLIHMTSMAPASGGPGAAVAGPPPEVRAAVARVQQGGMFLGLMIVVIVGLMVLRPTI